MKREESGEAESEGGYQLGLCVLCGLPASGKSTLARSLSDQLRRKQGWDVAVITYDDIIPEAFFEGENGPTLSSQWKSFRQELLMYLERFLMTIINRQELSAPITRTGGMWERFVDCLKNQDSLGYCQLFLDCPVESCLERNKQRSKPLPDETIQLMARKIESPNIEKNTWEHKSLVIRSRGSGSEDSIEVTDLLTTALKNPIKCFEENMEQKETDRIICSTNILHQADQTFRRIISQTMKKAKDEKVIAYKLKLLAEELTKLKADFLEDLRHGNSQKIPCSCQNSISDIIHLFHYERDNIVHKYIPKEY
ncbi:L-seryl-tRNA(Sec) kinase isoform X2 [Gracilinanus agilis]|uniref:L-seryl-tRNA(Sec) kinase isoform X2 n=1 Tax=Gracilinanus agilis TaxID=191870 RepID=UPI001CFE92C3|nr:L-seryl-tRNA(Sec) kinase isoform X2 [Gracilinanus agilis]